MKKLFILLLFGLFLLPNFIEVKASDDNYGFDMNVKTYQGNVRTGSRYRSTTNTNNSWKVKMTDSWECSDRGDGCITTFWLEVGDGTNVSKSVNKAENQGYTYTQAYSSASKKDVYLTAENNNYSGTTYRIKGVWDEETW